jgi:hypothetical protein
MTDLKRENWGQIGTRVVCHDYGHTTLMSRGLTERLRRVTRDEHAR